MEQDPNLSGILFHAVQHAHHNALRGELTARGLEFNSPTLIMLLQSRGKDGALPSQRELADALQVSPAAIAMSLKTLERLGYAERQSDPDDQRRKRVVVTQRGAAAAKACWAAFREIDRRMLDGFTDEEREMLCRMHRRMLRNLGGPDGPFRTPFERMECQCSKP